MSTDLRGLHPALPSLDRFELVKSTLCCSFTRLNETKPKIAGAHIEVLRAEIEALKKEAARAQRTKRDIAAAAQTAAAQTAAAAAAAEAAAAVAAAAKAQAVRGAGRSHGTAQRNATLPLGSETLKRLGDELRAREQQASKSGQRGG